MPLYVHLIIVDGLEKFRYLLRALSKSPHRHIIPNRDFRENLIETAGMSTKVWLNILRPITFSRLSSTRAFLIAPSITNTTKLDAQPINHSPQEAQKRKWLPLSCGILSKKVGMMPFFDEKTGQRIAGTVLKVDNVEVLMHRTVEENGYFACQVGYGSEHASKISRQMLGHFASKLVNPKEKICEFRVKNENGLLPVGTLLRPSFFKSGQYVDLISTCKGKGFAGVMKKYHFAGLRASHGTSIMHRHGGSYGQNQDPGRILPGKKMPGHMGKHRVTIQNSQILKVDDELGFILVKGSVAGPKGAFVKIQDAIKKSSK